MHPLLAEILHSAFHAPDFTDPSCKGRPDLFDELDADHPDRRHVKAEALALCSACPALTPCRDWFTSLPVRQRPSGVIAGQINRRRVARQRQHARSA